MNKGRSRDVIVEWLDGGTNTCAVRDLTYTGILQIGSPVSMYWSPDGLTYKGTVILILDDSDDDDSDDDDSDDDDDVPLAMLIKDSISDDEPLSTLLDDLPLARLVSSSSRILDQAPHDQDLQSTPEQQPPANVPESSYIECESSFMAMLDASTPFKDPSDPDDHNVRSNVHTTVASCEYVGCGDEIFAACVVNDCRALLCFDHFDECGDRILCHMHRPSDGNGSTGLLVQNNAHNTTQPDPTPSGETQTPETFIVEGADRGTTGLTPPIGSKRRRSDKEARRNDVKMKRNLGQEYNSEKSGKNMPSRRIPKPRCACSRKTFSCQDVSDEDRERLNKTYHDIGDLAKKREWLLRFMEVAPTKSGSTRKKSNVMYKLPVGDKKLAVCKKMFLNTLNIAARQVTTARSKVGEGGIVIGERRGGRQASYKDSDQRKRSLVSAHIDRFPKVESHYCRQNTSRQYLHPSLSISRMHDMYREAYTDPHDQVSYDFYLKVFKEKKLSFHRPKKDQCSLCDAYRSGTDEEKAGLQDEYNRHIQEKEKVRAIRDSLKMSAQAGQCILVSSFDLEQVMYVPKSKMSELFYKRLLSCYNFTICNIANMDGFCYLWHEGIAKRGANAISSNLFKFCQDHDRPNFQKFHFFADGCYGQNKNSILPSMLMYFLERSTNVEEITVYYFETNHGQNEGDSLHSCVERTMEHHPDVMLPSQLATIIKSARKKPSPLTVYEQDGEDFLNWKAHSRSRRVLSVRTSVEGHDINWTAVMQVQLRKDIPNKIFYKTSHNQVEFFTLDLSSRHGRKTGNQPAHFTVPRLASEEEPPKLSAAKYMDLMSLCEGPRRIVRNSDHVNFYKNLPH